MGAGKTTIGKQLSKKLSASFYDSDHEIEQRTGANISLIFEIEGETGFRKREAQVLAELVQLDNIVLSTGGGAVLDPENRKKLNENGLVVYLKSTPEKLYKRTMNDRKRPLLQGEDRLMQIKKILTEREPLYLSLAHEVIDTDKLTIKQILQKILNIIECNERD